MCTESYEQWEAVNEVLSRYAFLPNEAEELAKVIVALEAEKECLINMLLDRHTDEETIEEALAPYKA